MTYKYAISGINMGGGKGVIWVVTLADVNDEAVDRMEDEYGVDSVDPDSVYDVD